MKNQSSTLIRRARALRSLIDENHGAVVLVGREAGKLCTAEPQLARRVIALIK